VSIVVAHGQENTWTLAPPLQQLGRRLVDFSYLTLEAAFSSACEWNNMYMMKLLMRFHIQHKEELLEAALLSHSAWALNFFFEQLVEMDTPLPSRRAGNYLRVLLQRSPSKSVLVDLLQCVWKWYPVTRNVLFDTLVGSTFWSRQSIPLVEFLLDTYEAAASTDPDCIRYVIETMIEATETRHWFHFYWLARRYPTAFHSLVENPVGAALTTREFLTCDGDDAMFHWFYYEAPDRWRCPRITRREFFENLRDMFTSATVWCLKNLFPGPLTMEDKAALGAPSLIAMRINRMLVPSFIDHGYVFTKEDVLAALQVPDVSTAVLLTNRFRLVLSHADLAYRSYGHNTLLDYVKQMEWNAADVITLVKSWNY
jgi:hypothetical protein